MNKRRQDVWKTTAFWRDVIEIAAFFLAAALVLWMLIKLVVIAADHFRAGDTAAAAEVSEEDGAGRATSYLDGVYAPEAQSACIEDIPRVEVYAEGEGPAPEWYRPDEEMAVEWTDSEERSAVSGEKEGNPPAGIDPGGVDWNICSSIVGWDGRMMEIWELDLWARVFYLEFYGASDECCAAGCDAMLNLWATGKYGRTMFDCLSYYDPDYGYTYEVYPWVWDTTYDPDGLEWCRGFCEERFVSGPEWGAAYFQLGGYHDPDWVTPAYEIDGVYFSMGR